MLRLKPMPTTYVGGVIAVVTETTDPEYTVELDTGEIVTTSDVAVDDLVVDDWLVCPIDSTTDDGVDPVWEAMLVEDFTKYFKVIGG